MEDDFNPDEYQGRSKEHIERNYTSIKIFVWFAAVILIVLVTTLIVKYIAK